MQSRSGPDQRAERQLVAVVAADIAGYSRLMGADEEGTLARLKTCRRELIDPGLAPHRGRIDRPKSDAHPAVREERFKPCLIRSTEIERCRGDNVLAQDIGNVCLRTSETWWGLMVSCVESAAGHHCGGC